MQKTSKWKLLGVAFLGAVVLTGCTKSFCTVQDKANMMVMFQNTTNKDGKSNMEVIIETVDKTGNYFSPSDKFFEYVETKTVDEVKANYGSATLTYKEGEEEKTTAYTDLTNEQLLQDGAIRDAFVQTNEYALTKYAKAKATELTDLWSNYNTWRNEALDEGLTLEDVGSSYYHNYMQTQFNNYTNSITACITPVDGNFDGLKLEGKTWGEAFSYGLLEGLLVWPISAMLYYFAQGFSNLGAGGVVLSIFFVTLIVRAFLLLITFKQTASQQRMTELQPEMAKIQAKYPNANTNQYEKQLLAQEQMALYKKYKINPLGMIFVLVLQFIIFIPVWGAMSGSAILRAGEIGGLQLSANTGQSIINWTGWPSGVALIIFIIMALAQAVSMLLPQYLQKRRNANVSRTTKNPAADSQAKTMKIMNVVMLVMIIFMGFNLPVAMAIYWIISALISLGQSLIMSHISNKHLKNKSFAKYKTK